MLYKKLRKIILIGYLALMLVFSSPAYVLAQEAPSAPSAPSAPEAPNAEPTPAPDAPEASSAPEASPVPDASPEPSGSPQPSTVSEPSSQNQSTAGGEQDDDPQWKQDLEQQIKDDLAKKYSGGNVGDTSIETGDATAAGVVATNVNSSAVNTGGSNCGACSGGGASATNSGNGSGSANDAAVVSDNNTSVYINNDANVTSNLGFDADSGNNDSSGNVGDTEIITGDANVVATVITNANTTALGIYEFNVNGNQNGDIILGEQLENCVNCGGSASAVNTGNGSESTNSASVTDTNTTSEVIENDGEIVNWIDIDANSGNNTASKNTGGDSTIETGDANVVANVINTLNTVVDGVLNTVNIFGDLVGNIVQAPTTSASSACSSCECGSSASAANTGNGSGSDNNAEVNTDNSSTTTMTNNATVVNNLGVDATTGDNETNFNTGGESLVETGDAIVNANVVNVANVNVASGDCSPVYMVFINDVTGGWQGDILGAAPGTYFYTSSGEFYFVDENGQLVAVNAGNGADSTNSANVNASNSDSTTITNNGSITNNISIDANTGGNDASKNTGGDSTIKTGNANVAVNVVNFINSNFSGRKVVMTLVNVFGSWLGNFVPAGYTGDIPNPLAQATGGAGGGSSSGSNSSGGSSNVSSNGGGTNAVSIGGQVLAAAASGAFKSLVGGSVVENNDEDDGGTQVSQYRAVQTLDGSSIPVPLRFILIMVPLAALTFILRKKAAALANS